MSATTKTVDECPWVAEAVVYVRKQTAGKDFDAPLATVYYQENDGTNWLINIQQLRKDAIQ